MFASSLFLEQASMLFQVACLFRQQTLQLAFLFVPSCMRAFADSVGTDKHIWTYHSHLAKLRIWCLKNIFVRKDVYWIEITRDVGGRKYDDGRWRTRG